MFSFFEANVILEIIAHEISGEEEVSAGFLTRDSLRINQNFFNDKYASLLAWYFFTAQKLPIGRLKQNTHRYHNPSSSTKMKNPRVYPCYTNW